MDEQPNSTDRTWTMKEAAKTVGVGLPRLYERLREKELFTRIGTDGRNVPTTKLQREGFFIVRHNAFYDKKHGIWRPCPKVVATYLGLVLFQEIADELDRESEQPKRERPRIPDPPDDDPGESEVRCEDPNPQPDWSREDALGSLRAMQESLGEGAKSQCG